MKGKQKNKITTLLQYYSCPGELSKYSDAALLKAELQQLTKVLQFASSEFPQKIKTLKRETDDYASQVQQTAVTMNDFINNFIPMNYMQQFAKNIRKPANPDFAYDVLAKTTHQGHEIHRDNQQYSLEFQMKLKFLESQGVNPELWSQYFDKADRNLKIRDQKYCIFMCLLFKNKQYTWSVKKVQSNFKKHDYLSYYFAQIFLPQFKEKVKNDNLLIWYLIKSLQFCQFLNLQIRFQECLFNDKIYKPKQSLKLKIDEITYEIQFPDVFKDHSPIIKLREVTNSQLQLTNEKQQLTNKNSQKMQQQSQKVQKNHEFLTIYVSPNCNRCELYIQQNCLLCDSLGHIDGFVLYQFLKTVHFQRQKFLKLKQHLNIRKKELNLIFPLIKFRGRYLKDSKISSQKSQDIQRQAQQNGLYILASIQPDNQSSNNSASKSSGELQVQQSPIQSLSPLNHSSSQIESATFNLSVPTYLVMFVSDELSLTTQGLQPGLINNLWQKYSIEQVFYHIDLRKKITKIPYSQARGSNQHFQIPFGIFKILTNQIGQNQSQIETQYLFRQHKYCFKEGRTVIRKRQGQLNQDDYIIAVLITKKFKDIKFKYWRYTDPGKSETISIYFCEKWKNYLQSKSQQEVLNVKQVAQAIQYFMYHFMTQRYFVRKVNQRDKNTLKIKLY